MRVIQYFLLSIFFLSSCNKLEWNNPFDPECPKELFTPSQPGATMVGNNVRLTWSQENKNISGFSLFRRLEDESIVSIAQTDKRTNEYLDSTISPGKKYTYYLLALAGENKSDTIKAEITPIFPITITTGQPIDVGATTAKVSGNITSDGGGMVTSRGICYSSITRNPTVNNSKTTEGTGIGQFTSTLSGLLIGTEYFARAYGENSRGIVYGKEITFVTSGIPSITTTSASQITTTSFKSGGVIELDGGLEVIARGVCWSTSPSPTTANSKTNDGTGIGTFTSEVTGLKKFTTYYLRSYATNIYTTVYGEEIIVRTLNEPTFGLGVSDIEGNFYKSVIIGNQEWMAENLKTTKLNDGKPILFGDVNLHWEGTFTINYPVYTWYNNDSINRTTYGGFYNWYCVETKKLCPTSWHVPSREEWILLETFLGGDYSKAGGPLKQVGTTYWNFPNIGATNETGFNAIPAGFRSRSNFYLLGMSALFWTSTTTPNTSFNARPVWIYNSGTILYLNEDASKVDGLSIRCVKD